ncbi:hypothetical protein ABL78_3831 [Leptomonas seymouri]|uniref:Uncharacterized protein n=1 Tax=Leptomonas seymouri TaxID=5684 RepID=A0A0N0P606_LEPSE|nr:hypothetical protein ABL78_3831 [Leptomonas seymouri]|eukprot:KPI87069.1 hypothetical protein ABL78_3831 [Leptomonas seymouri]
MQEDGSDAGSVVEALPQEQITMLLNKQDFSNKVCQDEANLCCIIITSTICRHCGIRRIPYPKAPALSADGAAEEGGEEEDLEEADGEEEEDEDDAQNAGSASGGRFYRDFEEHLVHNAATTAQRRNVRFFHVCACAKEETCIDFLIAEDPAYNVLNKKPTPQEISQLQQTAHNQLKELLALLDMRSTPQMCFYLAGQPLRYSMMSSTADAASSAPAGITEANDLIVATGANRVKWARVLENAVVVRNAVMRDYDAAEREKARLARVAARRLAREARKREEAEEGDEEDDE